MKHFRSGILIALFLFGCKGNNVHHSITKTTDTGKTRPSKILNSENDKEEIQDLVRKMLNWSWANNSINLLPALTDKDSICTGFDLTKLQANLDKLRATGFFTSEFIDNYKQIILTLDSKIRNNEFDKWSVNELPSFSFDNDDDPWCLCQDVPYDKPNPWSLVEVEVIKLNAQEGQLNWKWGKPELNGAPGWKDFRYKFEVKKENGKWKISYLQGFDFKESIKKA